MAAADLTSATWVLDLTDVDLEREVGVLAVARANTYAEHGRVRTLVAASGGQQLLSTVAGAERSVYQTVVQHLGDGQWSSACSCPVRVMCKHAVATIVATRSRLRVDHASQGWESVLRPLVEASGPGSPSTPQRRALSRLGLEVSLAAGSRGADGETTAVQLTPVREGVSKPWIRRGAAWRDLVSSYSSPEVLPAHREALAALYRMTHGVHHFYGGTELALGGLGPLAWSALAVAMGRGVELVPGPGLTEVELGAGPVEVVLDLRRTEDGGVRMVAGPLLDEGQTVSGDRFFVVGRPGHGLGRVTQEGGLTLWPLATPPLAPITQLLERGTAVEVPAGEVERFRGHYLAGLARSVHLRTSNGSVTAPEDLAPRVLLRVRPQPGHRLELAWSFAYPVVGGDLFGREVERSFAELPLQHSPDDPPRDDRAESVLLAEVIPLLRACPSLIEESRPGARRVVRLHPERVLTEGSTVRFVTQVLPSLQVNEHVEVLVEGELAAYQEADDAPVVTLTTTDGDVHDWFDLHVTVTVAGEQVPFEPLFAALARGDETLMLDSGTWFRLDRPELEALRRLIEEARALDDKPPKDDRVRISRWQASLWQELQDLGVVDEQSERWQQSVDALLALADGDRGRAKVPDQLTAQLRPYQQEGFSWMATLWDHRLGGVLADDMGLGKTLQVLAVVARAEERGDLVEGPVLVVAPASVVQVWAGEAARFTPQLRVATLTAGRRRGAPLAEAVGAADVVVTTYDLLRRHAADLAELPWSGLVLDEAQAVKNRKTKGWTAARDIGAERTLVLTGTPLENSLMDLWSLASLAAPGLFGRAEHFQKMYATPIEAGDALDGSEIAAQALLERLRRRLAPFMLRRTKAEVAQELPTKVEQLLAVDLEPAHRRIYDRHLQRERQRVLGLLEDPEKNRIAIFRALTVLRQLALDPSLVDEAHAGLVTSAKITALLEQLRELAAEGHRALVFSSFTSYLALVRTALEQEGIGYTYLDGSTRDRRARVEAFREGEDPVFLISLKAGGVGLTLTEADYVFLLDPWWNPAAEAQAVDRTHRIGQTRPVHVYRLVSTDTVEEKVVGLQERKRQLFATVVDSGRFRSGRIGVADVRALLEE
ncbi:DEAD/DEAH box helicase [Ornithinimicrobium pratense]|uniref:DEAD/DEAH box helicase n=1 Tax=Ornithinimicrobium pratense TaxID=2593973 RepID=A0A5J6V524_9MICO|nr:DEAD/DEAH box helicase [Ornithinimicrobium pratense]QFG68276.1 DEAD/DEAH box helicase [Ornithinimicrobium pratense]